MATLDRIEKSTFRKGEYVGYANGVWHIRRANSSYGNWSARHRDDLRAPLLFAWKLSDLNTKLAAYAGE